MRIPVIDDDADMRELLEQTLKAAGYEVAVAANGWQGIDQCRASPADLVITDVYMPNQEGLETIMELHQRFPELPVIAMSGRPNAHTQPL